MHNTTFDWFSMDLPLFLRKGFRFAFVYKKRESSYSRKFVYNFLDFGISVTFIIAPQISNTEFHKNF